MNGALDAMGAILQVFSGRQDKRLLSRCEVSCLGVMSRALIHSTGIAPKNLTSSHQPAFYSVVLEHRCLLRKRGLQTLPASAAAAMTVRHRAASIVLASLGTSISAR